MKDTPKTLRTNIMLYNINFQDLLSKIKDKKARLAIIGSGYVGLPTSALFANAGFNVVAVDLKSNFVQNINEGISPIDEPGLQELISKTVKAGTLRASLSSKVSFKDQDVVIICVQTPVDKTKQPDFSYLKNAINRIGENMKVGSMVVVCSTIPPGTIQEIIKPKLASLSSLEIEKDLFLAYVPERIAPGKALREFAKGQRLVGGIGVDSTKLASELFSKICKITIQTDAKTAEVAKLAENTFRDINIAFANQLALICEQKKVDVNKAIKLANTHPRVNIHQPGPGVGGPCLTKDPYLLTYKFDSEEQNLIKTARKINDNMPNHIITLVKAALEQTYKKIDQTKISILGTAYKANVGDERLSPSKVIIKKLLELEADVVAFDPHCEETFGAKKVNSISEAVRCSDCFVILTDHDEFKSINLKKLRDLMTKNPSIVDSRRIIDSTQAQNLGFLYFAVGYNIP